MRASHYWISEPELWVVVQFFITKAPASVSVIGAPCKQLPSWLLPNHNMIYDFTFVCLLRGVFVCLSLLHATIVHYTWSYLTMTFSLICLLGKVS